MRGQDCDHPLRSRGQAFTLEAVVASVVVLGSLLFALQVSGVTSLTASTSSGQVLQQEEATASGVLDAAAANESIKPTVLIWDGNAYTSAPPTAFGRLLEENLRNQNLAYNVHLSYMNREGGVEKGVLVRNGVPSDDAARATRTVTLYNDDDFGSGFDMPDAYPGGPVYNVVRVEVVVWPV